MSSRMRRGLPLAAAACFSAVLLLSAIATTGLGEPFELDAADRAQRFAHDVLGAHSIAATDGAPGVPPLEVPSGPLPTALVALGFASFGLGVTAGRIFVALAALAGVASLAFGLARLVDRRAAAYGVVALSTMPLFFVQARTMLGDAVTMSANAAAFAGLAVAMFDRRQELRARAVGLAIGVLGLAAGALCRGAVLGVAVPMLGVGIGWALQRRNKGDRTTDVLGVAALIAGCVATAVGARAMLATPHRAFDEVARRLGHALFPWSALLPVAWVALLSRSGKEAPATRALVVSSVVVAGVAHAVGAEAAPFVAPAVIAAAIAIAARDLDELPASGGSAQLGEGLGDTIGARSGAFGAALLLLLLAHDLGGEPRRALASIGPMRAGATLAVSNGWLLAATAVFAAVIALVASDRADPEAPPMERFAAWPRALFALWEGRLGTGLVAVEATLSSIAIAVALRPDSAPPLGELALRAARHAWWIFPLATVALVVVPMLAFDLVHRVRQLLGLPRGSLLMVAGALAGAMLAWGYYPALLGRLSPRSALAAYSAAHAPGEPLAALGVSARAAALEVGVAIRTLPDAKAADAFLTEAAGASSRSWLVVRGEDLPALNALVRAREHRNVVIVGGAEAPSPGEGALLVASSHRDGDAKGTASLDDLILPSVPAIAHPIDAGIGEALTFLGWELSTASGAPAGDGIAPLDPHRLRFYYRVDGKVEDRLCSFVHIDGQARRFSAEHREFPRYPLRYWQRGDVIVDDFDVTLASNFTPGPYNLRAGFDRLPCDGKGRLTITRGPHDADNRVLGGTLHVR